jgi:hypothetical protein
VQISHSCTLTNTFPMPLFLASGSLTLTGLSLTMLWFSLYKADIAENVNQPINAHTKMRIWILTWFVSVFHTIVYTLMTACMQKMKFAQKELQQLICTMEWMENKILLRDYDIRIVVEFEAKIKLKHNKVNAWYLRHCKEKERRKTMDYFIIT